MRIDTHHHSIYQTHERTSDSSVQHKTTKIDLQMDVEAEKSQVRNSVDKMNDFIEPVIADLKFVYHDDLHEYYVTVVNPLTDEVIREIPPKKMLDIYAAMTEYVGILVDKRA